tara:strand:+ start:973 stop:1224 length:252 start_codon:yes stop_codon:yes gene_type:complete
MIIMNRLYEVSQKSDLNNEFYQKLTLQQIEEVFKIFEEDREAILSLIPGEEFESDSIDLRVILTEEVEEEDTEGDDWWNNLRF